jgi:GTP-binding protein
LNANASTNRFQKESPIIIHESRLITSAPGLAEAPPQEVGVPEIVLVGRSNVGKSSWINSMLNRKSLARTSNTPGKTRLMNFYEVRCSSPQHPIPERWYFVDLPGYGYAKVSKAEQADWNRKFQVYLKKRERIDMVVQLVDGRHGFKDIDAQMLDFLLYHGIPAMVVLTKLDKCTNRERAATLNEAKQYMDMNGVADLPLLPYSAMKHEGRVPCWLYLMDQAGLPNMPELDVGDA